MPAGMVAREEGGARPDQWLMVLFHGPAEVSSADGMQWVDADTVMIWPPGPRQVLGHAREPWDHSWIFARGARLQAVVEASGCRVHHPMPLARVDASEQFFSDCHREAPRPDSDQRMVELLLALWLRSCARCGGACGGNG